MEMMNGKFNPVEVIISSYNEYSEHIETLAYNRTYGSEST